MQLWKLKGKIYISAMFLNTYKVLNYKLKYSEFLSYILNLKWLKVKRESNTYTCKDYFYGKEESRARIRNRRGGKKRGRKNLNKCLSVGEKGTINVEGAKF